MHIDMRFNTGIFHIAKIYFTLVVSYSLTFLLGFF